MSSSAASLASPGVVSPVERLDVLFEELAELTGQRNAIDGRLVEIVAEMDRDRLCGATGARSIAALVAWKTGTSPLNAETIATIAHRLAEFPLCAAGLREGRFSLDQVGVIASRAGEGSDAHYAKLATHASVRQLRTAIKLEPRPKPRPDPAPQPDSAPQPDTGPDSDTDPEAESVPPPRPVPEAPRSFSRIDGELSTTWRITLPHAEAATFEAAVRSHTDALFAAWTRDRTTTDPDADHADTGGGSSVSVPPLPSSIDGFMSLVHAGWDTEVAARPHGQRTTVVVHLDLDQPGAALHLGPFLSDAERRLLTCDADCEIWFQRHGQVIGSGRASRQISRRLRRALEHRDRCCTVPGCGATRGLQAHHIQHWEDGGLTELINLTLLCPFHHRLHHRGVLTITGTAEHLTVTDKAGRVLTPGSLARPPTRPPPVVAPCTGSSGERADWWWYDPYQPPPPPTN